MKNIFRYKWSKKKFSSALLASVLAGALVLSGCGSDSAQANGSGQNEGAGNAELAVEQSANSDDAAGKAGDLSGSSDNLKNMSMEGRPGQEKSNVDTSNQVTVDGSIFNYDDMFTERELTQTVDTSSAMTIEVNDSEDVTISEEGIYVITGSAKQATIYVEAEDTDKVQLVLDGVSITNTNKPAIYVVSADKVFVTTASNSSLTVTGDFTEDENSADAVIFSKEDLVLNGTGTLTIESSDKGVVGKDDLIITGATYVVNATSKAFDANDSIAISGGNFTIKSGTDGIHADNSDDDSKGYIYISGGTFNIDAGDDGIRATSALQIDGGSFTISAVEGLEATYVQINGGTIDISASDDGINATQKSGHYPVVIEITGGDITVAMGSGDTDALDANGDLIISGGTIDITAQSAFDYDNNGTYTGGTITVNGEVVTELTQSMMGPGGNGRFGGQGGFGGRGGQGKFGNMNNDAEAGGQNASESQNGETPEFGGEAPEFNGEAPEFNGEMPEGQEPPEFNGGQPGGPANGQMQGFNNQRTNAQN